MNLMPRFLFHFEDRAFFASFGSRLGACDEWRWRLFHDSGNVIADGHEGYERQAAAERGIERVQENAPGGEIEVLE